MTEHDALVRAICEHPDDDTPRLIYADFLDETGEPARGEFVRAQVELARTPAWEPFAVLCRHRQTDWAEDGRPFRHTLPPLPPGWGVDWHDREFRRGLGWRVHVRSLIAWNELAPRIFEQAPVGELDLNPPATFDNWRAFAAGDWLRRVRVVHLDGASPVEPIRVLCAAPAATGITDIHFHRASSPGLPVLIEDLFQTPLGLALRGLHFHVGYESSEALIDALNTGGDGVRLERLSFRAVGITPALAGRLAAGPVLKTVTDLRFRSEPLGAAGVRELIGESGAQLRALGLADKHLYDGGWEALAACPHLTGLRQLDLSGKIVEAAEVIALGTAPALAGLRALNLARAGVTCADVDQLTRAAFWPNLIELDLRQNGLRDPVVDTLVNAPQPPELTALLLDRAQLSAAAQATLREHFGDRLILDG